MTLEDLERTLAIAARVGGITFHYDRDASQYVARMSVNGFAFRGTDETCGGAATKAVKQMNDHNEKLRKQAAEILARGEKLPPGFGEP